MEELTPDQALLWAARQERAKRWRGTDLKGYPTVDEEHETEETLKIRTARREETMVRQQLR